MTIEAGKKSGEGDGSSKDDAFSQKGHGRMKGRNKNKMTVIDLDCRSNNWNVVNKSSEKLQNCQEKRDFDRNFRASVKQPEVFASLLILQHASLFIGKASFLQDPNHPSW